MTLNEIARLQAYLRKTFDNNRITVMAPERPDGPVEFKVGDEFLGVLYKDDEDEGDISYSLMISILEDDLPSAGLT